MKQQLRMVVVSLAVFGLACGSDALDESASASQGLSLQSDVAVAAVRGFLEMPDQEVTWLRSSALAWNHSVPVAVFRSGRFQFEVNARTHEVIQFGPRPLERPEEDVMLAGPRMEEAALEARAREYIAKHAGVDLSELKARHSSKGELAYFFRWTRDPSLSGAEERFIQVGMAADGRVVSYTNTLGVPEQGPVPLAQTYIYSNGGNHYFPSGPPEYWWKVRYEGYCGHITSACTPNNMRYTYENPTRLNYAVWDAIDTSSFAYPRVLAFIPRVNADAVSAHYILEPVGAEAYDRHSYVNQSWYSDVWVDITPSNLTSLNYVMLEDVPGGTVNLNRKIGFDEIQVQVY